MSLVPYHPQEGREIVLRHRNAIVVHDATSQRLEIRSVAIAECPTCHRLLRSASPERPHFGDESHVNGVPGGHPGYSRHEGYVDPNYFRLLRAGHHVGQLRAPSAPSSPSPSSPGSRPAPGTASQRMGSAGSPLRRLFHRDDLDAETDSDDASLHGKSSSFVIDGLGGGRITTPVSAGNVPQDAEFVSSTPYVAPNAANPINKEAFSPNYFRTFFVEERELGRGGKGVVLLVRHEIDGCQLGYFACKRVPVGDDHAWLEKVLVEVELLAKLSHPNLVSYRHVWLENVTLNRFGPSVACAFILQQYCNSGDLHHYIIGDQPKEATKEELKARRRRLSKGQAEQRRMDLAFPSSYRHLAFDEIYSLFKDITSGLAYLHAANYIHRDLKPSNCLLHREGRIVTCLISDFGEVQAENVARKSTGTTGTISYCAPEVLRRNPATGLYGNFTTKSDVFSLGMILYFMCFGRLPYRSANAANEDLEDVDELRAEISQWKGFHDERRERPDLPSKLYHLLKRMLSVSPAERPSASEVLLAMRTEPGGFDGASNGSGAGTARGGPVSAAAASPVALGGRRIQSLDSPVPSAVPGSPDRSKTARAHDAEIPSLARFEDLNGANGGLDQLPSPILRSPMVNPFAKAAHQSPSSSPLRGRRGSHGDYSLSRSPERETRSGNLRRVANTVTDADEKHDTTLTASSVLTPRRRSRPTSQWSDDKDVHLGDVHNNFQPNPGTTTSMLARTTDGSGVSTYLLMPPPTTRWGEARYRTALFMYQHAELLAFFIRAALFVVKVASLARPCWPYNVRAGVGLFVLLLAALDLGMPRASKHGGWWGSLILLASHFAILELAARGGSLCAVASEEPWDGW
ncbi:putative serine/threonine-protein kinase iks1 [Sporothrix epigloea]|uniref:Serine/threonine-protein kinase iks1 n=1 Tax=Sporothrix epigloea TaxID=1892477 RepID=A0ABP0DE74_9PEZI